jgi:hypothetical protein
MYYFALDIQKKTISYCVKDTSGIQQGGKIGATRRELNDWRKTLPQPWTVAMEATIFTGWVYDHALPHPTAVKFACPVMPRAIAAAKKNDCIDAGKIADRLRCDFLPECHMATTEVRSAMDPALPAPAGAADGPDEEPDLGPPDGDRVSHNKQRSIR